MAFVLLSLNPHAILLTLSRINSVLLSLKVLQRVIYLYRALGYAALLWAKYYSPRPHSTCSTCHLALVIPQYKVLCVRGNTAHAVVVEKVLNPNTTGRMTRKALLNVGMAGGPGTSGGYIGGNKLFKICVGLGSSGLVMDEGRVALLRYSQIRTARHAWLRPTCYRSDKLDKMMSDKIWPNLMRSKLLGSRKCTERKQYSSRYWRARGEDDSFGILSTLNGQNTTTRVKRVKLRPPNPRVANLRESTRRTQGSTARRSTQETNRVSVSIAVTEFTSIPSMALAAFKFARNTTGVPHASEGSIAYCIVPIPTGGTCCIGPIRSVFGSS
ncbi:hypothetical protein EDB86DRAFT_2828992 [Lactarius hatsudake]|nr:hypothetical protein EDB86DRAFT_2828992 [Lactarius hatsudake]